MQCQVTQQNILRCADTLCTVTFLGGFCFLASFRALDEIPPATCMQPANIKGVKLHSIWTFFYNVHQR